ncbi:response regulator transcription factor [Terrabacter sp. C0L_2]|uniref:response regulator transcription factor n=1 Tax=Terrabacter sp. C0L_2 TaxID=3108389 RepID=UPI00182CB1F7|nr:response regulator transcription factor [Dermatophilaceae bacterium]WVM95474.1 response regulator transcription factor [Terrabacter sp. C0L_2]
MSSPAHPPATPSRAPATGPTSGAASARILVVEDEKDLAKMVGAYLERAGYAVDLVHNGHDAVDAARTGRPDAIVLDLGLPGLDGVEVCRQVRTFSDCYILMLTARDDEVDKLVGLSVGADDYITKPFSPRELVARVQVVLRRPRSAPSSDRGEAIRTFGDLSVDVESREVHVAGQPVELTRTEFDILAVLTDRPRLAYSRRQLIDEVWDAAWVGDEHIVDVHVAHLRRKLGDDPSSPRFVDTVRGVGYRMGTG